MIHAGILKAWETRRFNGMHQFDWRAVVMVRKWVTLYVALWVLLCFYLLFGSYVIQGLLTHVLSRQW